jgi:hypothetical protein
MEKSTQTKAPDENRVKNNGGGVVIGTLKRNYSCNKIRKTIRGYAYFYIIRQKT